MLVSSLFQPGFGFPVLAAFSSTLSMFTSSSVPAWTCFGLCSVQTQGPAAVSVGVLKVWVVYCLGFPVGLFGYVGCGYKDLQTVAHADKWQHIRQWLDREPRRGSAVIKNWLAIETESLTGTVENWWVWYRRLLGKKHNCHFSFL